MAKMMVFIAERNKKLHVSACIGRHQVFTTSLLKSFFVLFCYKYHHFSHIIVVFLMEIYPSLHVSTVVVARFEYFVPAPHFFKFPYI